MQIRHINVPRFALRFISRVLAAATVVELVAASSGSRKQPFVSPIRPHAGNGRVAVFTWQVPCRRCPLPRRLRRQSITGGALRPRTQLVSLPPLLRLFDGCARVYIGRVYGANVIKLSRFEFTVLILELSQVRR